MDTKVEVRKYQSEDAPQLNEMVKKVFGVDQDVRIWKWKYEDNPLKDNCSYVSVADGRIVAHIGGIRLNLQIRGEKFRGCQLGDLMSDPEHRVKGAFTMAYLTQNLQNLEDQYSGFGFANLNSTDYIVGSMLAARGPMIPRLDRVVNLKPFIRRKLGSSLVSNIIGAPANLALRLFYSAGGHGRRGLESIEEITSFDERFDKLWARVAAQFGRTPERSSEYLDWRYIKHPTHKYKIFAFIERDELQGYIVLRTLTIKGIKRGLIIDLITDQRDAEVWEALLARGVGYLTSEGVGLITCWMFEHEPCYETMRKMRFVPRPSDLTVLVYGVAGDDVEFLNDPKNWHVSMGDSDMW